jgi:hypothetical protein
MKNRILAMEAAPTAIPVKPKMAAMMATTRNMTVQRSIVMIFKVKKYFLHRLSNPVLILVH